MAIMGYRNAQNRLQDVSPETPLPVHDRDRETQARNADTLLIHSAPVSTAEADLFGNTSADIATLAGTGQYRTLIWTGVKTGAQDITYTVRARTVDADGNPLGSGWIQIATGTISGAAGTWFRVVISQTDGLYYDQYRITVSSSAAQTAHSKIVGVRG